MGFIYSLPPSAACFLVACAVAAFVAAATWLSRFRRFGLWSALALVGHAAALQMLDAGNLVRYQHYRVPRLSSNVESWLPAAFLILQVAIVLWGLKGRLRHALSIVLARLRLWQLVTLLAVLVVASVAPSFRVVEYTAELCLGSVVVLVSLANYVLAAAAFPRADAIVLYRRVVQWRDTARTDAAASRERRAVLCVAVTVAVLAAALAYLSYERHPHVPDEVVYLTHAKYFASGRLWLEPPPVPSAFEVDLLLREDDRWFSPVPPGWPAILSVGQWMGAAWLVNPILTGINVILAYILLRGVYNRLVALCGIVLLAVSPWYVFMGMNFMTHMFTLTCVLVAAVSVKRFQSSAALAYAAMGGASMGVAAAIRPLEGVIAGVVLGIWIILSSWRRSFILAGLVYSVGVFVALAPMFVYNWLLAGSPLEFPIMAYTDKYYGPDSNALGFGADRGLGWTGLDPFPGHGLRDVLLNTQLNTFLVNTELFGWGCGSILFICIFILVGRWSRADVGMMAFTLAIVGVHALYWFNGGPDFGARYWFLIIIPCVAITARGIGHVLSQIHLRHRPRLITAVALAMLSTLVNFIPWRAVDKYHHYRGMRPDVRHLADRYDFEKSVVLIRGERHPDYASAAAYNPIDWFDAAPIYVWDRNDEVRGELATAYANRTFWVVNGPSVTGQGYEVIDGPLTADAVLAGNAPVADSHNGNAAKREQYVAAQYE